MSITGATMVAGIAGCPVTHSLSPVIHNAWIAAAGLDAVYVPFNVPEDGFAAFATSLRGGIVKGINVTIPFKETALELSDLAGQLAEKAGAANLLTFQPDGQIVARNTDLPTPEPAKMPSRWPRQQVVKAFSTRTPRSIRLPTRWRA